MKCMTEKMGVAYAFFDCDATKQAIVNSMPQTVQKARTPEGSQLELYEGTSGMPLDRTLREHTRIPGDYRVMTQERIARGYSEERKPLSMMRYGLIARCAGVDNRTAANELSDIVNCVHREHNRDQEMFRGAIVFEENGEYQLHE